ncbi:ABC transporter permease [Aeromicrobium alkaliterrae]
MTAVLVAAAAAVAAPDLLAPHDPLGADPLDALSSPSFDHPLGTDQLGRDVLSRLVHGARRSIGLAVLATGLAVTVGTFVGLVAGMSPRVVDEAVSRLLDVVASFPTLLLALTLIAFVGPGSGSVVVALGSATVPHYARVVRARTQVVRRSEHVAQARTLGLSSTVLVRRHVLPQVLAPVVVLATLGVGGAVLAIAGLSFVGMGVPPPAPEWGSMLAEGRNTLAHAWWISVFPGIALVALVITVSALGQRLQGTSNGPGS